MLQRIIATLGLFVLGGALLTSQGCSEESCRPEACDPGVVVCPKTIPAEGAACKLQSGIGAPICDYGTGGSQAAAVCACRTPTDAGTWLYHQHWVDAGTCTFSWFHDEGCPAVPPTDGTVCNYINGGCFYSDAGISAECVAVSPHASESEYAWHSVPLGDAGTD